MDLPPSVSATLARGIAAYLRDAPKKDIPSPLRRFVGFRDQALKPHRSKLIAALDDDDFRSNVAEWLDDHPSAKREEARVLAIAVEREDGWEKKLAGAAPTRPKRTAKSETEKLRAELERERAKASKAKEDARAQREAARAELREAKHRAADLAREVRELTARLRASEAEARSLRAEKKRAEQAAEKDKRSLRREADRSATARAKAESRVASLKRDVAARDRQIRELKERIAKERARAAGDGKGGSRQAAMPRTRRRLPAPKGLLEDAPETLRAWLSSEGVRLVVDGYNVGKEAYPDLVLETVRKRVVDGVVKLARRHSIEATVVFDGAEVAPGTARRRQGRVKIEYSPPDVIADDVIVDLVQTLPPYPVVVVPNDRGLQERVLAHKATVATSNQFLALIR